ncbi:MAG: zinc metalloprotease HtpX [Candidatus Bathyarchaeota archaeon]|nr:zinc metalloprotease HtpX [Candidatus Bathyarchaeota archaeon]
MSLWKLRVSIFGTLAIIIGISTLFFAVLLGYLGFLNIFSLVMLVGFFNIIQWLFAPYLINRLYRVREVKQEESPKLYRIVERLSAKSGVKKPKLGISNIPIPNAFAYGSPIAGNHVAITQGLLDTLEMEEVEAVLGHEFGHLKHRDVQIMMLVSFLPSLFYLLGRSAMFSAYFGRRRREGGGTYLIGAASMFMYFVLLLFTMGLSRLREYYADRHSASIIEDGSRRLSEGLAKIVSKTGRMRMNRQREAFTFNSFKALFISDPDAAEGDSAQIARYAPEMSDQELVKRLLRRRITGASRLMELFSTHPNITKRLKALRGYSQ